MGLSYNPSSFATNKTILEAIEELKRYLMANPLACIYEMSGNVDPNILTYNLTGVIVPDGQELKVGDILLSDNGYYAFIDEIGETTVTVLQWTLLGSHITAMTLTSSVVSVESTPTYLTGWIYRANAWATDRYRILSYDLTLTYEDDSMFPSTQVQSFTLPLQSINAIWYYLESDNSTTIYVDVNKDDGTNEVNSFSIPAGVPGQDGADGVSITGATIDASNHLILTLSDGNTIDAGALPTPNEYTHSVAISSTSGTFTDDEFAKLGYGDSTIIYTDAYSVSTVYKLKIETASILEFESIDATSKNNLKLIDVNKTTKAYSSTSVAMIKSATFDSGTATSGKVLTANGSGGASWETVSAGSVEGTSILSTGETSGKVLTANGSGGASWESASGGTTLNSYYTSVSNINTQYTNICKVLGYAKGRVTGYFVIRYQLEVSGVWKNVDIEFSFGTFNSTARAYGGYNDYFVLTGVGQTTSTYADAQGVYVATVKKIDAGTPTIQVKLIGTGGTVTDISTPTFQSMYIYYYNDSQLH